MPQSNNPAPDARHAVMRRFWRIFRLIAVLAIVIAAVAVLLVARGDTGTHIHMLIATALMAGMVVLVGGGLMSLVFLSASSGHDELAQPPRQDDEQ